MSIILKGIDLPTKGETLIVGIYGDGNVSIEHSKPLVLAIEPSAKAIQIPRNHGRLIDMDDSIVFHGLNEEYFEEYKKKIFKAHGILEAEKEE